MPLYEYQCLKCGRTIERIQKFSDRPLTVCPHCGGKLERMISSPAIRFKGPGFYINDYARKGASAEAGKSDGGSSESKPSAAKAGSEPKTKGSAKP